MFLFFQFNHCGIHHHFCWADGDDGFSVDDTFYDHLSTFWQLDLADFLAIFHDFSCGGFGDDAFGFCEAGGGEGEGCDEDGGEYFHGSISRLKVSLLVGSVFSGVGFFLMVLKQDKIVNIPLMYVGISSWIVKVLLCHVHTASVIVVSMSHRVLPVFLLG